MNHQHAARIEQHPPSTGILPLADRLQSNADEAAASCERMAASLAELDAINERQQRDFERIFGKAARS